MTRPKYSIIVPVYNRPEEAEELLESLTKQTFTNFEVILVEDGSTITCENVFEKYLGKLSLQYFFKPNTGPGPSRNFGFERALGDYFVIFDSDCIIPPKYFEEIEIFLSQTPLDGWGGPDRAHENFTPVQRAMGYTMSSVLTTGGFKFDRFAEDIEYSIRLRKAGYKVGLIPEAYVYHKRRTDFKQFYRQVSNFGRGRILVGRAHPGEVKLAHWFPAFFLMGLLLLPIIFLFNSSLALVGLGGYIFYLLLIAADCFLSTRSIYVSLLSVPAAFIQLAGYGFGFLKEIGKL